MIVRFYCTKNGYLVRKGECQEELAEKHAKEGEELHFGDPPEGLQLEPPPAFPYYVQRRDAYPSVGEQMDALWHGMDQGLLPKIEPFYSQIKAVKQRYPKE